MLKYYRRGKENFWARNVEISPDRKKITTKNGYSLEFEDPLDDQYPKYCSWAGFNGWVQEIQEELGLEYNETFVQMLIPDIDLSWIQMYEEDELESFVERMNPFTSDPQEILDIIDVWFVKGYNRKSGFNINDVFYNGNIIKDGNPRTKKDFHRMKEMAYRYNSQYIGQYNAFKLWKKSKFEVYSFGYWGKIIPRFVELLEKFGEDGVQRLVDTYSKEVIEEIDPQYLEFLETSPGTLEVDNTWKGLVKSGVSLQTLFKGHELTKAQMTRAMTLYGETTKQSKNMALQSIANIKGYEIPDHWFQYINYSAVLDWAEKKKKQLMKSRTIYGPAGASMTLHYHQLLQYITPEMLEQGPKTAWRKIMARLEDLQRQKIQDSLGSLVTFQINDDVRKAEKSFPNIQVVDSNHALREEGEVMEHCVAGYVRACIHGKSIILHIESAESSTAEIGLKDGKYVVFQHWGRKNSNPPKKNREELDKFVDQSTKNLMKSKKKGGEENEKFFEKVQQHAC